MGPSNTIAIMETIQEEVASSSLNQTVGTTSSATNGSSTTKTRVCSGCGDNCESDEFTGEEWSRGSGLSRCVECVHGNRVCAACRAILATDQFTDSQWSKGRGKSRCTECVVGDRVCAECRCARYPDDYSNDQWIKGPGASKCMYCVDGTRCKKCGRIFTNKNNLDVHVQQAHRPRNVVCPICGHHKFGSGAGANHHAVHCCRCPVSDKFHSRQLPVRQDVHAQQQHGHDHLHPHGHGHGHGHEHTHGHGQRRRNTPHTWNYTP